MNIKLNLKSKENHNFFQKSISLLLIIFFVTSALAQTTKKISAKVFDQDRNPIIGATIRVKGDKIGAVSDVNGAFKLENVPENSTIIISYIGYDTKEISSNSKTFDIVLNENTKSLDEVVVIGYGTVKKRDLTGSISSVSSAEIEKTMSKDVYEALQGQTSGVQITTNSGAPGGGASVRIRGTATFGAGVNPLYVIDGMPMDNIDDVNPGDIESMEVLKDAASAAIYGSRSANGVIIITTKKGKVGKPKIDIKYFRSYNTLAHSIPQTTPDQFRYYDKMRLLVGGTPASNTTDSIKPFFNSDINMQDYLFRTSTKDQLDLSVSAASDKIKYYASAGMLTEDGIVVNSDYQRLTSRLNVEYSPSNKFTIGHRMYASFANQTGLYSEQSVLTSLYDWVPYWSIFTATGDLMHSVEGRNSAYTYAMTSTNKVQDFNMSLFDFIEYKINKNFTFTSNLSGRFSLNRLQTYKPSILVGTSSSDRTTGVETTSTNYNWLNENYLSYSNNGKVHSITALVGNSMQYWGNNYSKVVGLDYTTDAVYTINFASSIDTKQTNTTINEHSMLSYYGRLTYSYLSKYLFAGNLRADASSRFGKSNKWGAFPSASVGWRLSDESFMKWAKPVLYDAKIRASYGITGNEAISNYAAIQIYSPGNIYQGVNGISPTSLAYDNLGWEQTEQKNIGIDLNLFSNRLRITADYYDKQTSNLLYNVQLPKETGYGSMTKNVGEMSNNGLEFMIGGDIIAKKDWKWEVAFNVATSSSIVKKLADGTPFFTGISGSIYVHEGSRIGEFYGYNHDGIFAYDQSNAFTQDWTQLTPVFANGVFQNKYLNNGQEYTGIVNQKKYSDGSILKGGDVNWLESPDAKDGYITTSDRVIVGCAQADFFGGLNSTLSYKDISLFVSFYYSIGGEIYNNARKNRNSFQYSYTTPDPEAIYGAWTKPGDIATYPRPVSLEYNRLSPSDSYIEDGSYIKLRNLKISYKIPDKLTRSISLKGLSVYAYGNNLLTWSAYKGFDPEFSGSSALDFGIDTNRYPRKREFGFGLNVNL